MFVGFDSQNTSHSFPHYPNWNLWVPWISLFGFRGDSGQIMIFLAYKFTFSYSELHPVIFYIQGVELCRVSNVLCPDSFAVTGLTPLLPWDVSELRYVFHLCQHSNQTAPAYCHHERLTSICPCESPVPFSHFVEH